MSNLLSRFGKVNIKKPVPKPKPKVEEKEKPSEPKKEKVKEAKTELKEKPEKEKSVRSVLIKVLSVKNNEDVIDKLDELLELKYVNTSESKTVKKNKSIVTLKDGEVLMEVIGLIKRYALLRTKKSKKLETVIEEKKEPVSEKESKEAESSAKIVIKPSDVTKVINYLNKIRSKDELIWQLPSLSEARLVDDQIALIYRGIENGIEGAINCPKCKGTKGNIFRKQTRSADEPMTVLITCLNSACKLEYNG